MTVAARIAILMAGGLLLAGPVFGQGLPPAPKPVPGSLMDPNRNAKPPPAAVEAPKEEAKPEGKPDPPPPKAASKPAPAPKPPAKAAEQPRPAPKAAEQKQAPPPKAEKAATPPRPPRPPRPKLEPLKLKVPPGYGDAKAVQRSSTEVFLRAVGPDLAPRFEKGGACAKPKSPCPDFVNLIVARAHDDLHATVTERYRAAPEALRTGKAAFGLEQILPRAARGYNKRHFLAQADGKLVWLVCHRYDGPKKPRAESRYCDLSFDAGTGLVARLIFHEAKLGDWRRMHAAAARLVEKLKG